MIKYFTQYKAERYVITLQEVNKLETLFGPICPEWRHFKDGEMTLHFSKIPFNKTFKQFLGEILGHAERVQLHPQGHAADGQEPVLRPTSTE